MRGEREGGKERGRRGGGEGGRERGRGMERRGLRDERNLEVVPCCYARDVHAHVEEDKGHDDVIHVALVTWEEDYWNSLLPKEGSHPTVTSCMRKFSPPGLSRAWKRGFWKHISC